MGAQGSARRRGPSRRKQFRTVAGGKRSCPLGSLVWCLTPAAPAARSLGEARWRSLLFRKSCPLPYPLALAPRLGAASESRQQRSSNSTPPEPDSWAGPPDPRAGLCSRPQTRARASRAAAKGVPARVGQTSGLGLAAPHSFHSVARRAAGERARAHMHTLTHTPSHTRNRLGQGREEEGDVASHGVTLTSCIPVTLWRGR